MADLFDHASRGRPAPLADRMRPRTLDEVEGQDALVRRGGPLRAALEAGVPASVIFWGPPGTGKTTIARILAETARLRFVALSAVTSGIKEVRAFIEEAREARKYEGRGTLLFIDEIHRFNKAQQDAFLPHVEDGTVVLVGATTENPSFEVNQALLSRCRVHVLAPLDREALGRVLDRALADDRRGLGATPVDLDPGARDLVLALADGDARRALNTLESAAAQAAPDEAGRRRVDAAGVEAAAGRKAPRYDKGAEEHYNVISALHKSLRGGDPQAALYWLVRMLEAGEDPLYVARRMVRFASEDVGCADPRALLVAQAAAQAVHLLGMPEADTALAQAAVHLALAPKSNALYVALGRAREDVQRLDNPPVPLHLRNAVTPLMRDQGYGRGYLYPHDHPGARVEQAYLPEGLEGRLYYEPTDRGEEAMLRRRLEGAGP